MTRAKDISKIVTDADLSGTLDVTGEVNVGSNIILNSPPSSTSDNISVRITGGTAGYSNVQFADADDVNIGMIQYNHSSNYMQFTTNDSERMRITSAGQVGIGVVPETTWNSNIDALQLGLGASIYGDNTATGLQISANAVATLGSSLNGYKYIGSDKASTYQQYDGQHNFRVASSGSADGAITWNTALTVDNSGNVGIGTSSPSTPLDVGGHIRVTGGNDCDIEFQSGSARRKFIGGDGNELELGTFSSSNTSRDVKMTIDSTGHTSISADKSGGYALGIVNDGNNSDRYGISIQCGSDSGSGTNYLMGFKDGDGNSVGSITFSGSSSSYNTSSDHRLKENVIADWDATTRLKQLNPVRFNFIAHADTTVDGFLAHEVQSVVPEAITGTHNEVDADGNPVYQGIDQSKLVPLLVKTIQELEARIVALETA
jgi:hypothetical protein